MDPILRVYESKAKRNWEKAMNTKVPPPLRFRASEVDSCRQMLYFRLSGEKPGPISVAGSVYGDHGNLDHDKVRQDFKDAGVDIRGIIYNESGTQHETIAGSQVFQIGDTPVEVASRADGLIEVDGAWRLLEIKNTGINAHRWLETAYEKGGEEGVLTRIKEKHAYWYKQILVTQAVLGYTESGTYLVVRCRENEKLGICRQGILVPFDQSDFDAVLSRLAFIQQSVVSGTPPGPEYYPGSMQCDEFCAFRYVCHDAVIREQQNIKPYAKYPHVEQV